FASTLDGAVHGPATVPGVGPRGAAYWARQLRGTVRFSDALAAMAAAGAETFLECGPGAVLCALGAGGVPGDGLVPSLRGGRDEVRALWEAAGRLHGRGLGLA